MNVWTRGHGARRLLLGAGMAFGTACGGGDPIVPVPPAPPPPTPAVSAVTVSPGSARVRVGQPVTLTASVTASGGASTDVSWSTSDASVATVPESGGNTVSVTTLAPGTVTITARSRLSSSVSGSTVITVEPRPDAIAAVTLSPPQPFSLAEQATADLTATATGIEQGATVSYVFSSSNPAIATVSPVGATGAARVTAVAPGGPVQITATATGSGPLLTTVSRATSVAVTVTALPSACTGFTLEPRTIALAPGGIQAIVGTATGRAAGSAARFTFVSSNVAVATVDSLGRVTAVAPGTASIAWTGTCTGPGFRPFSSSETVPVTVSAPPALLGVSLTPATATVRVGQQVTLTPSFDRASPSVSVACTFASDSTAIAVVSNSGLVSGVAPGRAPITVSCTGTGTGLSATTRTASALVTVTAATNACTAVALSPNPASVTVGSTSSLAAVTGTAGAGVVVSGTWSSSATSVATVAGGSNVVNGGQNSTSGTVTGIAPGTAVITYTASCSGGGFTTNQVQAATSVLVTGITVPPIASWDAYLVGGPVRADVLTRGWAASATTWFVAGSDDVSTAGGGLWRTTDGGVNWSKVAEVSSRITAVTGTSATDVWFGTADGRILQFTGSGTVSRRSAGGDGIFGLYVSGTTAFAITGTKRIELAVSGGPFALMTNAALGGLNLYHINGSGPTDVFAAGDSGVVLRWNGTAWARSFTIADQPLISDIYVAGPGAVWVGGTTCAAGCVGRLARLSGSVWVNETALSIPYVDAIAGSGTSDVYVLNFPGDLRRFNGSAWTTVNTGALRWNDGRRLMVPRAGGPVIVGSYRASIQEFTGTSWTTRSVVPDFYDAATSTGGTSYFVGDTRTIIGASGGVAFSAAFTSQDVLYAVHPVSETELYAGGVNAIVRVVDGQEVGTSSVGYTVLDVHGAGGTIFAVGTAGGMSRLAGTTWTAVNSGVSNTLRAIWMASPRFGVAGGENGTLLRYDGSTWQRLSSPTTARIVSVWGADSANVWIATELGNVLRWNGTAWSSYLPADGLRALAGGANSAQDLYLATTVGLRRISNNAVTTVPNPSLAGVTLPWSMSVLTSAGLGAAVGPNGVLWTGRPSSALRAIRAAGVTAPRDAILQEAGRGTPMPRPTRSGAGSNSTCRASRC